MFVHARSDRYFAENFSGAQLKRYLSWMRKVEMEKEADDIDEMRSAHLSNVPRKGGDAVLETVVLELNRKLSIN